MLCILAFIQLTWLLSGYTLHFLGNTTHYKTKSVHFGGLMNSATKTRSHQLRITCSLVAPPSRLQSTFSFIWIQLDSETRAKLQARTMITIYRRNYPKPLSPKLLCHRPGCGFAATSSASTSSLAIEWLSRLRLRASA